MRVWRFRILGQEKWQVAFSEEHLAEKLDGRQAEIMVPGKPWYVQLYRRFFPLKGIEVPADGVMRTIELGRRWWHCR